MHSILHPEAAKDGEASKLNYETPVKKVSVQAKLPSKFFNERLATPRVADEARPLRYRSSSGRPRSDHCTTETEVLVSALSSGNFQKPWPSRKVAEAEELVKYMSSVPCYLQRSEKRENVQETALNVGVIDWRRLERWTSSQKTDQINVVPSTVNTADSPSLFANESCSYSGSNSSNSPAERKQTSCRRSSNSPAERKQIYSLDGHWVRSDELKSRCMNQPPNSRTSPVGRSLWSSHEKSNESKHQYRTPLPAEPGSLIREDKSKSCDQRSSNHDGWFSNKRLERSFLEHGFVLDHLQDISCERSKTFSTIHGDINAMEVCNSLPGKLPRKYSHQSIVSRDILQSGLPSAMFHPDKPNVGATALPTKNCVTSTKFMTKNEEGNQISKPSGNCVVNTDEQSSNQKVQDISGGRKEALPKHPTASGLKWLNRSSSLKDISSSSDQPKESNGLDTSDDKGRCNSRGRRSPLRRILDPLLKSKYDGNSGPITSSPIHHSQEHRNSNSVSDASIGSSKTQMPIITPQGLVQDEKSGVPMRQALVKLAWKNGEPLFMFSTNEDSVLVASLRRTNCLGKEDSGGVYTIVMAQESKKKGGIWIGQRRNKKSNFLYDVVGRMEVSSSKLSTFDSKNLEVSKEFVLVRDEHQPSQECVNLVQSSQLAAIVVKAPYQNLNGSIYRALCRDRDDENLPQDKCSSLHMDSLEVEKYPDYARACSISAILPSGIHGFSDLGKPSTLIERWKSGGSCDCGGWDEGCSLTVLADRLYEMKVQEHPTTDGFPHIELFIQGRKAEKKHSFSMIAFKEGLYTIEFGSPITSLQAFAICIATLHSGNSIDALHYSANQKTLEDPPYDNFLKMNSMENKGGPTSYEQHHPPFSPVGRS